MLDPMECPCRPDLEAFWDGDLAGQEYEAVCRHLATCALCAAEHQLQEAVGALLRESDPAEPLPERAAQRIRGELLNRAALSEEPVRAPVTPRAPWGRVRSFCLWSPALAAVLLLARWAPDWLSPAPVPAVKRAVAAPPPTPTATVHAPALTPRVATGEKSQPGRNQRLRAPEPQSHPTVELPFQPAKRMVQVAPTVRPASTLVAPKHAAAPVPERLVIDLSGPLKLSQPPSALTLIASGSPDTPDGEAVIIRTEAMEEIP